MMIMMKNVKEHAPNFLKDAFYDLSILIISHLFYQIITQLLNWSVVSGLECVGIEAGWRAPYTWFKYTMKGYLLLPYSFF